MPDARDYEAEIRALACGDSSCRVIKSTGMSTNGGCRCGGERSMSQIDPESARNLWRILLLRREQSVASLSEIAALRAERDAAQKGWDDSEARWDTDLDEAVKPVFEARDAAQALAKDLAEALEPFAERSNWFGDFETDDVEPVFGGKVADLTRAHAVLDRYREALNAQV